MHLQYNAWYIFIYYTYFLESFLGDLTLFCARNIYFIICISAGIFSVFPFCYLWRFSCISCFIFDRIDFLCFFGVVTMTEFLKLYPLLIIKNKSWSKQSQILYVKMRDIFGKTNNCMYKWYLDICRKH